MQTPTEAISPLEEGERPRRPLAVVAVCLLAIVCVLAMLWARTLLDPVMSPRGARHALALSPALLPSLQALARRLGIPASSMFRLLQRLVKQGYVDFDESGATYAVSGRLGELGDVLRRGHAAFALARPHDDAPARMVEAGGERRRLAEVPAQPNLLQAA